MQKNLFIRFLILFPGLGIFYFFLMVIGDYKIGEFELFNLRLFGSPSVINLIEIPIAASIGLITAKIISGNKIETNQHQNRMLLLAAYALVIVMFFLFPQLPE